MTISIFLDFCQINVKADSYVRNCDEVKPGILMGFVESNDVHIIKYLNK